MNKDEKKRQIILKQVPFLAQIPKKDQIAVFNKAARSPIVLGVAFLLIFLLLYVQFDLIMSWNADPIEAGTVKRRALMQFKRMFVPIFLPAMGIFITIIVLRNALLKREIKKYLETNNLSEIRINNYPKDNTPLIRILDDGTSYLLIDQWPMKNDARFNEEEVDNFESILSSLLGVDVEQEDRDRFLISSNERSIINKLKDYLENK